MTETTLATPTPTSTPKPTSTSVRAAALSTRRLLVVAGMACASLLPTFLVTGLVDDRQARQQGVRQEIAGSWGPAQTVWGPTLIVPTQTADKRKGFIRVAPRTLSIKAGVAPEERHRGLFTAIVYGASAQMSGSIAIPESIRLPDRTDGPYLDVAVSAPAGIEAGDRVEIAGDKVPWQLCRDVFPAEACEGTVLVAPIDPTKVKGADLPFSATLHLHGSEGLKLVSSAKQVTATIDGAWDSPSFTGDELPATTRIGKDGFAASWHRDEIGRPRSSTGTRVFDFALPATTIGVDLIEATPVYRMIMRAAKYSPLLVALSFSTYLLFELLSGIRIVVVQYALLGASISLFAVLLLSVSEVLGYPAGYALSALLVLAQSSLYTASVGRRTRPTVLFASMLAGLFGFLYVLLGLESYALLVGTVALFVVLSVVMAVTQSLPALPAPLAPTSEPRRAAGSAHLRPPVTGSSGPPEASRLARRRRPRRPDG